MATVYILYSEKINHYYIGSCLDLNVRLEEHKTGKYDDAFTSRSDDWKVCYELPDLSYEMARKIETHIKKMKSKKYIENLMRYPEMSQKLTEKYIAGSSR